jgi:hypothetical protein
MKTVRNNAIFAGVVLFVMLFINNITEANTRDDAIRSVAFLAACVKSYEHFNEHDKVKSVLNLMQRIVTAAGLDEYDSKRMREWYNRFSEMKAASGGQFYFLCDHEIGFVKHKEVT